MACPIKKPSSHNFDASIIYSHFMTLLLYVLVNICDGKKFTMQHTNTVRVLKGAASITGQV
jgi:hypothetical protein